jgi:hypothetical protein
MAKLLKLRFLDETDKEKPVFVTLMCDGEHKGYFKKEPKELVVKSAESTTCRTQKGQLTEVRQLGYPWKQIDRSKFEKLLRDVNTMRIKVGWEPVELPEETKG